MDELRVGHLNPPSLIRVSEGNSYNLDLARSPWSKPRLIYHWLSSSQKKRGENNWVSTGPWLLAKGLFFLH
ncbi:MAG: hypothetical protein AB8G05_05105 [Oligoflexales bacterium]